MGKYISSADVADYLGLDSSNAPTLAQIDLALEIVEELVDEYCQTNFVEQNALTLYLDGKGIHMLDPRLFIRSITSISAVDIDNNVLYAFSGYKLMPASTYRGVYKWIELPAYYSPFPAGIRNVKVVGNFGLSTIPAAIKYAVVESVKHFFQLRDFNDLLASESNISRTIFLKSKVHYLPQHARLLLDKWRFMPLYFPGTNVRFTTG